HSSSTETAALLVFPAAATRARRVPISPLHVHWSTCTHTQAGGVSVRILADVDGCVSSLSDESMCHELGPHSAGLGNVFVSPGPRIEVEEVLRVACARVRSQSD